MLITAIDRLFGSIPVCFCPDKVIDLAYNQSKDLIIGVDSLSDGESTEKPALRRSGDVDYLVNLKDAYFYASIYMSA